MTINEKRKALGLEPHKDGDVLSALVFTGPPGGGAGFFKQGSGIKNPAQTSLKKKIESLEQKNKNRLRTGQCYARHNKIQLYYEAEAAKDPNITYEKIWRASRDAKTRFSHRAADGQTVPLDQPFIVGGEKIYLPCDVTNGSPGNVFGCRCQVDYRKIKYDPATKMWNPVSVSYGKKAILTDDKIANIIFNETASFSGKGVK